MSKTIWGNTVVKNEGRYLWYVIKSVIEYLDGIIIYDTGSDDDTVEIIKLLKKQFPQKIDFQEIGDVTSQQLTLAREKMLLKSRCDWILILDGDEVWFNESIKKTVDRIQNDSDKLYALVNPIINLIGDIYHYQEKSVGQYNILGRKGHFNIRAINRKIPGLNIKNTYPLEGFYDRDGSLIQEKTKKLEFIDAPIMHFSNLPRSSKPRGEDNALMRKTKIRYELGHEFAKDFTYPEVFYLQRPQMVPNPWEKYSKSYYIRALLETPIKKLKRKVSK